MPDYIPEKHHFIPAFAQRPWVTGNDGKVCEMRRMNGKVFHRRAHPNASGYKRRLYSTEGIPDDQAQHLELNFFSPLDQKADLALKRILAMDPAPWPIEQQHAWIRYLMSLMYRGPDTVALIKEHSAIMWREALAVLEADYDERRRPTDPLDFSGYLEPTHPAAPQIGASNFLATIINGDRVGPDIAKMNWSVIRPAAEVELLLSDKPLIRPFGLGDPDGFIMTPIAPDAIFLAPNDPEAGRRVSAMNPNWLVNEINLAVVGQAVEYVWGSDHSQIGLVRKHFGTSPLPPVITEEQRAHAVAAARGEIGRQ